MTDLGVPSSTCLESSLWLGEACRRIHDWLVDQLMPDLLKSDLAKSVGGLRLTGQVSSHLSIQLIKFFKIVRSLKWNSYDDNYIILS